MLSPVLWRQCGDGGHISDEQLHCHRALIIDKRRGAQHCFTLLHCQLDVFPLHHPTPVLHSSTQQQRTVFDRVRFLTHFLSFCYFSCGFVRFGAFYPQVARALFWFRL